MTLGGISFPTNTPLGYFAPADTPRILRMPLKHNFDDGRPAGIQKLRAKKIEKNV